MGVWNVLMDLLPFEWADHGFMRSALLAVLVISPLFGLLSTMVVESRMSFFSDALGHSAFTGIAVGVLCGLAGSYLAIDHVNRVAYEMSAGRGYIAVAVNILGAYNPIGSLLGSLIFGGAAALKNIFTDGSVPSQLLDLCPYLVTILVVTFAVRHVRPPAGIADSGEE